MIAFRNGPTYCETLSATSLAFPVEPLNTLSNGVIVMFGLAALYLVIKRQPRAADLYLLSLLLILTGIGSGIWHGFRDGDALFWEVRSGLLFLFALVFCWARRLWTLLGAAVVLPAFYFGFDLSREYFSYGVFGIPGRWVAITPLVLGTGIVMVTQTYFRSPQAALTGMLALASALVAVTFRTVDSLAAAEAMSEGARVCEGIPFGTHFLWHSFLSAGGFFGILTLMRLPAAKPFGRASEPAPEPAQ